MVKDIVAPLPISRYTPYTLSVDKNEESVFEEAFDNLREATQRLRATQHLMRANGMLQDLNHVDLVNRIASALAMTEAAGIEARRKLRKR